MKIHTPSWTKKYTEEELISEFNVDVEKWEAKTLKHNVRPTTVKRKDGEIAQVENFQTTISFQRRYPEIFDDLFDILSKKLWEPRKDFRKEIYRWWDDMLWTVLLADAHIDQADTKRIDMTRRKKRLIEGTKKLLQKIDKLWAEKLLFVNLWDYFNTAGNYKTVRWTEQQNIMSERDAWEAGIELQTEILELMSRYAPVMAKFIAGNHDWDRLHHLQDVMRYYFMKHENIDISDDKSVIQFLEWGNTMFGFDHGHSMNAKQVAEEIARQKSKKNQMLESYRGHIHHETVQNILDVSIHTVPNSWLQSSWEKGKWYRNNPSLTWLLHHKKDGKIAQIRQVL